MKPKPPKIKRGPGELQIENNYDELADDEVIKLFSDYTIVMPDQVLICRRIGERKTASGLFLPQGGVTRPDGSAPAQSIRAHEPTPQMPCLIVAVSPNLSPGIDVKVGEHVVLTMHAPQMQMFDHTRRGYSAVLVHVNAISCKVNDVDLYWEHNVDPLEESTVETVFQSPAAQA